MKRNTWILAATIASISSLILTASVFCTWAIANGASMRWRLAFRALCHGIPFRPLGSVVVKGKTVGIAVWEPLHESDSSRSEFLDRYGAAFAQLERLAPEAVDLFAALNEEDPTDPCVALYLNRLRRGVHGAELVLADK